MFSYYFLFFKNNFDHDSQFIKSGEGASSGRVATNQYAPGRYRDTGCDSLSLSSKKLQKTNALDQKSDHRFSKKLVKQKYNMPTTFENIKIATLNVRTLLCDIKLANSVLAAKKLNVDILALQEVRRKGDGLFEFNEESLKGWKFVWFGYKSKSEAGVAFILAPHVNLVDSHFHLLGRIMSIRIIIHGMCLAITNAYAPTEMASASSKTIFYRELQKALSELKTFSKFKTILLGDFNATIGMNSKRSGAWDHVLGFNNSDTVFTNDNGEFFLKLCSEYKLKIINSIFRSKRIHRGTWLHSVTGKKKRLDYITTRGFVSRFVQSCRVYNGASKLFDTDHSILIMSLKFPQKNKKRFLKRNTIPPKQKLDISVLKGNKELIHKYSEELDKLLVPSSLPTNLDDLSDHIVTSVRKSLESICPLKPIMNQREPWINEDLQLLISQQKHETSKSNLRLLQNQIKSKRKQLKNIYFKEKADAINTAAEARQVEKEFQLAKTYQMFNKSSKIAISKEKLTKHFEKHFADRPLPLPPELEDPSSISYLKDINIEIDESPPTEAEISLALESFKNNKSFGTDKVPTEGLKYQKSKHLMAALILLTSLIWTSISVPSKWLESSITCLYKKGAKKPCK